MKEREGLLLQREPVVGLLLLLLLLLLLCRRVDVLLRLEVNLVPVSEKKENIIKEKSAWE